MRTCTIGISAPNANSRARRAPLKKCLPATVVLAKSGLNQTFRMNDFILKVKGHHDRECC